MCDVCLWVAATTEERGRGLMGVTDLGGADGMVFVWDEPTRSQFWMRDTPTPLSIAFFDDGQFVSSADMEPCLTGPDDACARYPAAAPYTAAIEVFLGGLDDIAVGAGSRLELLDLPCDPAARHRVSRVSPRTSERSGSASLSHPFVMLTDRERHTNDRGDRRYTPPVTFTLPQHGAPSGQRSPGPKGGPTRMKRAYELMVIIDGDVDDPKAQSWVKTVTDGISAAGGSIHGRPDWWGKRQFAYPINRKETGYYLVVEALADGGALDDLERTLRLADEVVRHKLIRLPDAEAERRGITGSAA